MVRFLRSFSSPSSLSLPAFYVYRHLGAAVLELNFPLEAFLSIGAVVSSPAFYVYRTSSAVWMPLFFRYSAFSLSYYFLHLFCFASMALPPVIVRIRLEIWKRLLFPLSHPCCFNLLFTHCVTNLTHSLGLGLRVFCTVLPVSLPFSRGSVPTLFDFTIYFRFNLFKSLMKVQSSRFQRSPFSLGTGLQIRCMYFL